MKKPLFILLLIVYSIFLVAESNEKLLFGTLKKDFSPYYISENTLVPTDSILIIEPGVSILFQGNYYLRIEGKIIAQGTKNDSIYFGTLKAKGWNGIELFQKTKKDTSVFRYCSFFKADTHNPKYKTEKSALTINNYNFVKILNCSFYSNKANYGGALSIFSSNVLIQNTTFQMNYGAYLGGAVVISAKSFVKIFNSVFEKNITDYYSGALFVDKGSYVTIGNSLFDKNGAGTGGAIVVKSASLTMINSTITANNANFAGGLYCYQKADVVIMNSIIWGNIAAENDNIKLDETSLMQMKNCITERDDIAESLDNYHTEKIIYKNPKFNLTGKNPFDLADNSPAIDTGDDNFVKNVIPEFDLAGRKRFAGKSVDIGAFEKNEKSVEKKSDFKLFFLRYNLTKEQFEGEIKFNWNSKYPALIKIMNDDAELINEIKIDHPKIGENIYIWKGLSINNKQMPPGVYFYKIFKVKSAN